MKQIQLREGITLMAVKLSEHRVQGKNSYEISRNGIVAGRFVYSVSLKEYYFKGVEGFTVRELTSIVEFLKKINLKEVKNGNAKTNR